MSSKCNKCGYSNPSLVTECLNCGESFFCNVLGNLTTKENKKPCDYIIACDMDDTIEYLLRSWIEWLNNQYNVYVDYNDVHDWYIGTYYPFLTDEQIFAPLFEENMWKTVKPMEDAIEYIKKIIDEGYQFYIVTSSHYKTLAYKFENVLFKYFPFIDKNNLIICNNKQLINCDILIDDGPHNIVGNYTGILMTSPHNLSFDVDNYKNIYRVDNWKQIYDLIHKITGQ